MKAYVNRSQAPVRSKASGSWPVCHLALTIERAHYNIYNKGTPPHGSEVREQSEPLQSVTGRGMPDDDKKKDQKKYPAALFLFSKIGGVKSFAVSEACQSGNSSS